MKKNIHPNKVCTWLQKATLNELVDQVIWESIMGVTAHTGWTERARLDLVKHTQESVRWAIAQKLPTNNESTEAVE